MGYKQIDEQFLESFYNGNEGFKGKMISMFMEKAPVFMSEMNNYLNEEKWPELGASAHKFKSCIDFVGAKKLRAVSGEIESNAKSGVTANLPTLISEINTICDEVMLELKSELLTIKTE